jgi:hypothetical protein
MGCHHVDRAAMACPSRCHHIAIMLPRRCRHVAIMRPSHCHYIARKLPTHCHHEGANTLQSFRAALTRASWLPAMTTINIYYAETGAITITVSTGPYASSCSVDDDRLCCICQHKRAYTNRFPTCRQSYGGGKAAHAHARPPAGRRPLQQPQASRPTRARRLMRRPQVAQQQRGRHRARWLRRRSQAAQQQRGRHRAR